MRRLVPVLVLTLTAMFGATSLAGATVTPKSKAITERYFGKSLVQAFTSATGAPLSQNAEPVVGDRFESAGDLYHGDHNHYTKSLAASFALQCTFTVATANALEGSCLGVISIGGSLIISQSAQNFASQSAVSVYSVTGGTGVYAGSTGRVITEGVGNTQNSDFTVEITTP